MRYCFYTDGFNVYYSLNTIQFRKYKWLDYRELVRHFVSHRDSVSGIHYFTTCVSWKPDAVARHKEYIKALRSVRVKVIFGRFTKKDVTCHICGKGFKTREEKQTDVNIALHMVKGAVKDTYDRAVLISGDTDLAPAIQAVHEIAPEKEVGVVFPPRRFNNSLKEAADFYKTIGEKVLRKSQFPDTLVIGGATVSRPNSWY